LNFHIFHEPGVLSDEYELFVRLSRTSDNKLLAEGFASFRAGRHGDLFLDDLDLSNWSELLETSRLAVLHGERFGAEEDNDTSLRECMVNLTAVVVAVNKSTSKACLVAAQTDFSNGIDMLGREGYCWPLGYPSSCSHGRVDTDRLIKLGMLFDIVEQPVAQCQWFLQCTWFND
jgi:hypothetical protein